MEPSVLARIFVFTRCEKDPHSGTADNSSVREAGARSELLRDQPLKRIRQVHRASFAHATVVVSPGTHRPSRSDRRTPMP